MKQTNMMFDFAVKMPLKNMRNRCKNSCKISSAVIISGFLTILYCVEFSIGIRTIYLTFKLWNDPTKETSNKRISWTLCLACLLTATITSFTVNILSAIWEQKQLEEKGKQKNFCRFIGHIIVGGMLWRYLHLICVASKQVHKKNALLLTMTKFFFTQTFTVPMVIIHVSVTENIEELIFAIVSVFCISFNLILTCSMFAVCVKELEELKKWNYETVDLLPLIFQWDAPPPTYNSNFKVASSFTGKEYTKPVKKESDCIKTLEETIIKTLVLIQSFGFSLGRLLALGILVKLAGIYAVSIMFLQLLISIIYLKFQAPILVSDTLPKWRQLTRLAFLGYILIFEWHLNREPRTAYDFSFNMKHNIMYYCVATVESVFYLVTWTITTSIISKSELPEIRNEQNTFCRLILMIGSLALVFSLSIHILLLFWRSRKISKVFYSFRRRYEKTKIRLSTYGGRNPNVPTHEKNLRRPPISHIDISNPIPMHRNDMASHQMQAKQTSYRDLREPVDEEIEIFRKCEIGRSRSNPKLRDIRRGDNYERTSIQAIDHALREEINNSQNARYASERRFKTAPNVPVVTTSSYSPANKGDTRMYNNDRLSSSGQPIKSGMFSGMSGHLGKMSKKISGAVKDHFQKKKDPLAKYREPSNAPVNTRSPYHSPSNNSFADIHRKTPRENMSSDEGYFVNDNRCYKIEYSPSRASAIHQHLNPRDTRYNEDVRGSPSSRKSFSPRLSASPRVSASPRISSPRRSRSPSPTRSVSPMRSSPMRSSPMRSSSPIRSSPMRSSPMRSSPVRSPSPRRSPSPTRSSPTKYYSPDRTPPSSPMHRLSTSSGYSSPKKYASSSRDSPPPKITPSPMFSSPRIAPPPCLSSSPRKSPGNNKIYDASHTAHRNNGSPCPCYICKNSGDDKHGRRRSSSVPPGETLPKHFEDEAGCSHTSSKYMSNPNISQNRFRSERSDIRSNDVENVSAPPRVSRRNFNIGHLTAHGRVEHYV